MRREGKGAPETYVTSEGQVAVPRAIRDRLGTAPGAAVVFELMPDGCVALVNAGRTRPVSRFETFRGRAGPGLSTDKIMALTRGQAWE